MKNMRAIAGLVLLTLVAPSCGGGGGAPSKLVPQPMANWQTQQRVATTSDLRAVDFANQSTGLIGGKDGAIFRSDDAGDTWWQMNFTPASRTGEISVIRGLNKLVIAAGIDQATGNGRLWTSTDTISWTTPDVPATGSPYTDVTMSSPGIGPEFPVNYAALRQNGSVDVVPASGAPSTASSGTWTNAYGLTTLGNGLGYVCGDLAGAGQIRKTVDGGVTFTTDTLPAGIGTLRKVLITPVAQRAFAVGEDSTANHYGTLLTRDAPDQPWYIVPNLPPTLPRLRSVQFPTGEFAGWVVGDGGTIYRVTQVFNTVTLVYDWIWTNQNPASAVTSEDLYGVTFVGNDDGWIVGNNGTVLRTKNGTAAAAPWWSQINHGDAGINWNALSFSDDGMKGIAVGNGAANAAKIYRTIDGGSTWTAMTLPGGLTIQNLNGVSVPRSTPSGTTAYICGDSGVLYQNTDVWGTGSWTNPGFTGVSGTHTYRAVLFTQPGVKGVLAGNNGTAPLLLYTKDGMNWLAATGQTPPSTPGQYNSLSSNPAGTAVFASGNGQVNTSTDLANGWTTWSDVTMTGLPASTFTVIQSPNDAFFTAMVAAADGNVYRLAAGAGGTWSAQTGSPWGAEIPIGLGYQGSEGGTLNGMVATSAGRIFTTIDGGVTWNQSYPHTKALARTIWMSPTAAGVGYAGCDDGVILMTASSGQ